MWATSMPSNVAEAVADLNHGKGTLATTNASLQQGHEKGRTPRVNVIIRDGTSSQRKRCEP
jgi:hypothetical protein